jgi:hypothetical protein
MAGTIWLLGNLATHARGKVLTQAVGASAVAALPAGHGLCLAFGNEFQEMGEPHQNEWSKWAEEAGRTLVLIPPFKVSECAVPTTWRTYAAARVEPVAGDPLGKLLAAEVRFEVAGGMQTAIEVGGAWKSGGVHTAFWRRHPHSGRLGVTCLPLWSLAVLDHREALGKWLNSVHELAGQPVERPPDEGSSAPFSLSPDHYAILLHLCAQKMADADEALERLQKSQVLAFPEEAARSCLRDLQSAGLARGGSLTEAGRAALFDSPYAVYADAMERSRS